MQCDWDTQVRRGVCWTLLGLRKSKDAALQVQAVRVAAVVWEGSGRVEFIGHPHAPPMRFIGEWIQANRHRLHGLPDWRGFDMVFDICEARGVEFQTWEVAGAALVAALRALVSANSGKAWGERVEEDMTPVSVALGEIGDDVMNGYDPVAAVEGERILAVFTPKTQDEKIQDVLQQRETRPELRRRLVVPRGMVADLQARASGAKVELIGVSNINELLAACLPSVAPFSTDEYPAIAAFTTLKMFRLPDYDGTAVRTNSGREILIVFLQARLSTWFR